MWTYVIGVSSIINWKDYEFDITGQASNGIEALDLIKRTKPDLVITEINLDKLNGIELMKECRKLGIDSEFVIMSGTNEFNHVKDSFRLGGLDYILKSEISLDKMKEILETCLEKIESKENAESILGSKALISEIIKHAKHNYLKSLLLGTKGFDEMDEDLLDTFGIELSKSRIVVMVIKIKEYIRKNYNHKISLEQLAREIGLSYTYMSTLFKKEVGENIMDFLISCRIDAAKVMLMEGQYQISYISASVGYENEHYFSRMFKQRTLMSPTAYRQSRT